MFCCGIKLNSTELDPVLKKLHVHEFKKLIYVLARRSLDLYHDTFRLPRQSNLSSRSRQAATLLTE